MLKQVYENDSHKSLSMRVFSTYSQMKKNKENIKELNWNFKQRENRKMIAWYNVFVPVRLQYECKHIQNLLFSAFVMMEAWVLELLNCKIEGLGN